MIRAVIDANVVISGLFWDKLPGVVLLLLRQGRFVMLATDALLGELRGVLSRPKFALRFMLLETDAETVMSQLLDKIERVSPAEVPEAIVRDKKDRAVLACAVGGRADYIVTGDEDLLILKTYQDVAVVTPARFLEILQLSARDLSPE